MLLFALELLNIGHSRDSSHELSSSCTSRCHAFEREWVRDRHGRGVVDCTYVDVDGAWGSHCFEDMGPMYEQQ